MILTQAERIWIPVAAVIVAVMLGTLGLAQLAAIVSCGQPFPSVGLVSGIAFLFTSSTDTAFGTIAGCVVDPESIHVLYIVGAFVLLLIATTAGIGWSRYRRSDSYFRAELLRRPGFADGHEVGKAMSRRAMKRLAKSIMKKTGAGAVEEVSWQVGRSRGVEVRVWRELSMILIGPPRSGKGLRVVINAVLDAPGAQITTSTRADNLVATMRAREKVGPVVVFDPQGIAGVRSAMRWSPIVGAEDPVTATRRAASILASEPAAHGSNEEWAKSSGIIAAGLLHAAAVGGRGIPELRRWTANPGAAKEAASILEFDGADGWAERLEGVLKADPRLLDSNWHSLKSAFDPLFLPAIADSLTPGTTDLFDAREFLAERGTMYLIGTATGVGAVGGFLSAMLDDVVEEARRIAMTSPGSRIDPGLSLILDEIFNMFAWQSLPGVMSDGGGSGISTLVIAQSLSQLRTALGDQMAATIWASANLKLLMGGGGDVQDMKNFSDLLGHRYSRRVTRSYNDSSTSFNEHESQMPLVSVDELRRLPSGLGVLTSSNMRPLLLDMERWTDRKDAGEIRSSKKELELEQRQEFKARFGVQDV